MKHQIILIGKDITSSYYGIKEFTPDHIHLLFTDETKSVPDPMLALLPASLKCTFYHIEAYNPPSVMSVCRQIHECNKGDFYYNLTEGTKVMAFAAYHIAMERKGKPFYITPNGEVFKLLPFKQFLMKTRLDNKEIIQLNNNVLTSYSDVNLLDENDVSASWKIKEFIERYPKEHQRIQSYYNTVAKRQLNSLTKHHIFPNSLEFIREEGSLLILLGHQELLYIHSSLSSMLYFEGRWWETLVASKVKEWTDTLNTHTEVWQSVLFHGNTDTTLAKSEVDVLINNQQKLMIMECKSGKVNQNDVYKVDAVREIYGGDISQAILASYYPINNTLKEKCDSLQISMFAPAFYADRINYINTLPEWIANLAQELQI